MRGEQERRLSQNKGEACERAGGSCTDSLESCQRLALRALRDAT